MWLKWKQNKQRNQHQECAGYSGYPEYPEYKEKRVFLSTCLSWSALLFLCFMSFLAKPSHAIRVSCHFALNPGLTQEEYISPADWVRLSDDLADTLRSVLPRFEEPAEVERWIQEITEALPAGASTPEEIIRRLRRHLLGEDELLLPTQRYLELLELLGEATRLVNDWYAREFALSYPPGVIRRMQELAEMQGRPIGYQHLMIAMAEFYSIPLNAGSFLARYRFFGPDAIQRGGLLAEAVEEQRQYYLETMQQLLEQPGIWEMLNGSDAALENLRWSPSDVVDPDLQFEFFVLHRILGGDLFYALNLGMDFVFLVGMKQYPEIATRLEHLGVTEWSIRHRMSQKIEATGIFQDPVLTSQERTEAFMRIMHQPVEASGEGSGGVDAGVREGRLEPAR